MSLLLETGRCCLIDHQEYVSNIYKNTADEHSTSTFTLRPELFSIKRDKKGSSRKRPRCSDELHKTTSYVKNLYEKFRGGIPEEILKAVIKKYDLQSTSEVRDLSRQLFTDTVYDHVGITGGNNAGDPLVCDIKGNQYLVPPNSRFLCGCVKEQCLKLSDSKFNIIVADPPWWNKYIRRLKTANEKLSYKMMYNEDIAAIPVKDLCSDNCLVAVWCTNAPSNIAAVKDLIFPSWGVEYLTTWYWLKLTVDLEPLCDFSTGCKKQPYERLILGKVGEVQTVPEDRVFMSIPSALHSHKPPLYDLLTSYISKEPQCLELFARYLLPNTTSVGYEPLKWQHISLYV